MAAMLATAPPQPVPTPNSRPPTTHCIPRHRLPRARCHAVDRSLLSSRSSGGGVADWSFEQRMSESLSVLELMDAQSIAPDPALLSTLLKSCADARSLRFGRFLHERATRAGLTADPFVANNLVLLYSRCGLLGTARQLFDEMPTRNVVSWTTVISMYHHAGFHREAVILYLAMKADSGVRPNAFTYTVVLNSCAATRDLETAVGVHEDVVRDGCDHDEFVVVALVDMYAKCGNLRKARDVFSGVSHPSTEACTAMIEGCSANGEAKDALELIRRTLQSSSDSKLASNLGFAAMIRPCLMETALRQGQEIHAHIIKFGHKPGLKALSFLVELYANCDKMMTACRLANDLVVKDVGLWSRMISLLVRNGLHKEALDVFLDMARSDARLSSDAVSAALKACVGLLSLSEGKQIHGRVIKVSHLMEDSVIGDLAKLYSICGEHLEASELTKLLRKQKHHSVDGNVIGVVQ